MSDQENPQIVPEEVQTSKRKFDPNIVIAISLGVISLCALFVSVYQTKILADQQELMTAAEKAQLWPNINASFGGVSDTQFYKEIYFKVSNDGIGPAIIEDFSLSYDNTPFDSWLSICRYQLTDQQENEFFDDVAYKNSMLKKKQIIPAGESVVLFKMEFEQFEKFQYIFNRFLGDKQPQFSLRYSSVFGDEWILSGKLNADQPPVAVEKK